MQSVRNGVMVSIINFLLDLISATSKCLLEWNPEASEIKILLLVLVVSFLVLNLLDWEWGFLERYYFGLNFQMFPVLAFIPD